MAEKLPWWQVQTKKLIVMDPRRDKHTENMFWVHLDDVVILPGSEELAWSTQFNAPS